MVDYYVVSKALGKRIPCDGPATSQSVKMKLEEEMKAAGQQPDAEIENPKKPLLRARPDTARKRNAKQRYKTL